MDTSKVEMLSVKKGSFVESLFVGFINGRSRLCSENWAGQTNSAQRVPEPDPLPGISFDTQPDPIQF